MIAQPARQRSGITLTEILISILIMGIGLISLATLFPIGLSRLRDASRQTRSALLAESVVGDIGAKRLLEPSTFSETYYGAINPFLTDPNGTPLPLTANAGSGGLPFCYDPLWRSVTGYLPPVSNPNLVLPASTYAPNPNNFAFRFGTGYNLRRDPDGSPASAYGLQRVTNFVPFAAVSSSWPLTYVYPPGTGPTTLQDHAESTFVSPEDIVMQNNESGQTNVLNPSNTSTSGVVPMFFPTANGAELRKDFRYSWLITARQIDVRNGSVFEGDIVVMENRPFAIETIAGQNVSVPSGETTVEAIYAPGGTSPNGSNPYFTANASRTVTLRWPNTMPDPEIKVGSWFADVTYERFPGLSNSRQVTYPMQRCYWYQIAKKTDIINEYDSASPPYQAGYRRTTIYTTTPLRAQSLLATGGIPVHVNAALIMPSVVNVFSKTFYVR